MVFSGAVELTVGNQKRVLKPGDGYYFDSRTPIDFRNVHYGYSEVLSAITPPTY
ncbi:cupin domain-containing protein [Mesorhizobium sp. M1340]|uniref:cupin domain-containing protein n=1 Tax=Mesorhizobium sp. M1340 TaxID=2957087 RepID=UPI00333A6203